MVIVSLTADKLKAKASEFNIIRKFSENGAATYQCCPIFPPTITSQVIWFNKHIKIDNKSLCNNSLANQGINHVGQLFNENLAKSLVRYFWIQLINSIPKLWKE